MPSTVVDTAVTVPVSTTFYDANPALKVNTLIANVLTADINAGYTLIADRADRTIRVINFWMRTNGAFATGTLLRVTDSGTPVVVFSTTQAASTDGAFFSPAVISGMVLGAGFAVPLTAGKGLKMDKTGSSFTVGTSVDLVIQYVFV